MLEFYFSPGSSSMAVHIALHEIGAPFEPRRLSFWKGEQKTAGYLAINPEGKVPTLVANGEPLTEVAACLYYLARTYPKSNLFPANDIVRQSQILSWMSFNAARLHPSRNQGEKIANEVTALADTRLGARIWVAGEYSVADIHLFRLYWRFKNALQPPEGQFAHLDAHYARMMKRPAVIKTIEIETALGYEFPENKPQ